MSELCLHRAIIGLGSNLGEPEAQLAGALERMSRCGKLIATSSYYKTKPLLHPLMPFYGQSDFTNACAVLETRFGPIELLSQLQHIETELGRYRGQFEIAWSPRAIDLDLLAYDELVMSDGDLTLPHPRLHQRRFVLEPLCEIAPHWRHPLLGKRALELLNALEAEK